MSKEPKPFENIQVTRKILPDDAKAGYRVYTDKENFTLVMAETARAAIEASGVAEPYKLERVHAAQASLVESELANSDGSVAAKPEPKAPGEPKPLFPK